MKVKMSETEERSETRAVLKKILPHRVSINSDKKKK
jgi:hypothetical protein